MMDVSELSQEILRFQHHQTGDRCVISDDHHTLASCKKLKNVLHGSVVNIWFSDTSLSTLLYLNPALYPHPKATNKMQ